MAGRKVFQAATVLTATDVNEYLMDQSVMSFAGTAARASAIGTATEGMVTYLQDSNSLEFWNGAQWQNVNDNTASVPLNTVTAEGDLIVASGSAAVGRLGKGTAGQVLTAGTATLEWTTPSADIPLNTVTASGDLIVANGSASVTRLGIGTTDQVLSVGTAGIIWKTPAATSKTVEVFTSSTTWIVPAGVNYVTVYLTSGGPGGGSGAGHVGAAQAAARNAGGGSGAGGVPVISITDFKVNPGSTATVTIGAGGSGGAGKTVTSGSASGADGLPGTNSTFAIDGETITGYAANIQASGKAGLNNGASENGGSIFNNLSGTQILDAFPALMMPAVGGDSNSGAQGDSATQGENSKRQLFTLSAKTGSVPAAAQGQLAGTAGSVGIAGFVGAGGGGGGVRYSSNVAIGTSVYAGGNAVAGGGPGGASAYTLAPGFATASAGGAGAANSGAGGGGGGAASCQNGTAYTGAGGNGGSGFVIVTY